MRRFKGVFFGAFCAFIMIARTTTAGGHLLLSGARSRSLGNTGITFSDIYAVQNNPAGLAGLSSSGVALSSEQLYSLSELSKYDFIGALSLPSSGFGISATSFGNQGFTASSGSFSYGRSLGKQFAAGVKLGYTSTVIDGYGSQGQLLYQLGIIASISSTIQIGVTTNNPWISGNQTRTERINETQSSITIGFNYHPTNGLIILSELEKQLAYQPEWRLGLEYPLSEKIFIRAGFNSYINTLSTGVGVIPLQKMRIDFACSFNQYLGATPALSISYDFSKKD